CFHVGPVVSRAGIRPAGRLREVRVPAPPVAHGAARDTSEARDVGGCQDTDIGHALPPRVRTAFRRGTGDPMKTLPLDHEVMHTLSGLEKGSDNWAFGAQIGISRQARGRTGRAWSSRESPA